MEAARNWLMDGSLLSGSRSLFSSAYQCVKSLQVIEGRENLLVCLLREHMVSL
jgi:hypothetical protein